MRRFADRVDAGRALAVALERSDVLGSGADVVVGAIPRGGVIVGAEVARRLGLPLDVIVVRKLGAPNRPELGIGAIAEGGIRVLNELVEQLHVDEAHLRRVTQAEQRELERRRSVYRRGRPEVALTGRTVVVVDDGLATGSTALAAVRSVLGRGATVVVLAVPVAAPETAAALAEEVDAVVALEVPDRFVAVGEFYDDFRPTSDDEVLTALR